MSSRQVDEAPLRKPLEGSLAHGTMPLKNDADDPAKRMSAFVPGGGLAQLGERLNGIQ
jgi:hypothetical protein